MRSIERYENNILQRAKKFSVQIILLCSQLPKTSVGFILTDQLVRAGISIGANLIEAQEAVSAKDFLHKISIALKEAKETRYWLELINVAGLLEENKLVSLLQEIEELIRILVTISKKLKTKLS